MKDTQKWAKSTTGKASKGFTDEERAAMKQRAQELKAVSLVLPTERETLAATLPR